MMTPEQRYVDYDYEVESNNGPESIASTNSFEFLKEHLRDAERRHNLALDHAFKKQKTKTNINPQGFEVNHNIKWKAGDKIIDGIHKLFGPGPDARAYSESYHSCKEEGIDFESMIPTKETMLVLFVSSLLIFHHRKDKATRNFFIITTGMIITAKIFGRLYPDFDLNTLMGCWKEARAEPDVEMEEIPKSQGLGIDSSVMSNVLLIGITAITGYKAKKSFLDGLVNATKITETQTNNVGCVLMSTVKAIHVFLKSISLETAASFFDIDALSDPRSIQFQGKVQGFVASFNSGNPESMLYCADVAKDLMIEAKSLTSSLDKKSYDYKIVVDNASKIQALSQRIADMKVSTNGERVEPVGVLLKGGPATMKGILAKRIAKVVAMATMPVEWRPAYRQDPRGFYFAVPKDRFWDTYTNKAWVTFYDDIFQRRDAVADSEADALKVIDMINSAPFPLPMAKVDQKNDVFFRSAYVIATTNLSKWENIHSATDVDAVQRRFHLEVDVTVNGKYLKNGHVNKNLLPQSDLETGTSIPNDFWILKVVEKIGDQQLPSRQITLKELIVMCVDRQKAHTTNFHINRRSEDILVDNLAEELGYADPWGEYDEHSEFDFDLPKAQSGLPGSFIAPRAELDEYFASLDPLALSEYTNSFWRMTMRMGKLELYDGYYKKTLRKLFDAGINLPYLNSVKTDVEKFHAAIESYLRDCFKLGVDPYTQQPLRDPETAVNPAWSMGEYFLHILNWMENNFVTVIIGSFFTGLALNALSHFFCAVIDEHVDGDSQSVDVKRMGKRVGGPTKLISLRVHQPTNVVAQAKLPISFEFSQLPKFKSLDFGDRNNRNDVLAKMFNKYFFIAYIASKDKTGDVELIRLGHLLNVAGQIYLMPMHFVLLLDAFRKDASYDGASIILVTSNGSNHLTVPLEEMLDSFKTTEKASNKDLCLVKIHAAQKMSKGCISSVLKRADVENLSRTTSFSATIAGSYHPTPGGLAISLRNHYTQVMMQKGSSVIAASWTKDNSVYNLFDTMIYRLSCASGDCGSLVITNDSNYENRIICGIHVAGGKDMGYATGFDQELLLEMMEICFPEEKYFKSEEIPDFLLEVPESQSSMKPIYKLKTGYIPNEVFKSEITKSKFFKQLPAPYNYVRTMPARLKPFYTKEGELIDPLMKAFNKYGKIAPEIPQDLVDRAFESYENLIQLSDSTTRESRKVIPLKEALHSFDNINSISSSTSSGFPMSLDSNSDWKKIYYKSLHEGNLEEAERAYQRIAELVASALAAILMGIRLFWAYKQCGKDETREWFKVLEGKTRLFSACPFILLVLFRMYFGSFISMFVRNNIHIGSAVGVNPYSTDWDNISRMLLKFSDSEEEETIAAGDQGQFDTRQWTIIHYRICKMITNWYGGSEEDNYIRACLFVEIANSRHIFRGEVYEWNSGMPSGNPLTAIINTIYNNIIFRMSWELAGLEIKLFNDNVYLIVLGDDNAFSVAKIYRKIFNEETLPTFMAQLGNEYTTELKGSATFPFRKITEVEFLKRSFSKDPVINRWIAPLREEAIAEMLNWTKKGKEGSQITLDNVVFALREFSLHGYAKFEHWKEHLLELCAKHFPHMKPHGDFPLDFSNTYKSVLDLEYYF